MSKKWEAVHCVDVSCSGSYGALFGQFDIGLLQNSDS